MICLGYVICGIIAWPFIFWAFTSSFFKNERHIDNSDLVFAVVLTAIISTIWWLALIVIAIQLIWHNWLKEAKVTYLLPRSLRDKYRP